MAERICRNALIEDPENANFLCLSARALIMLGRNTPAMITGVQGIGLARLQLGDQFHSRHCICEIAVLAYPQFAQPD